MALVPTVAAVIAAGLILSYGFLVLFFHGMEAEFERFGLSRFRRSTGVLEVLGGIGLLVGLLAPEIMLVASGGLALLMVLGVMTRIRVRDTLLESLPAWLVLAVNVYIFINAWSVVFSA